MTAIPLPISIGLVGAPGSGKSQIAREFYDIAAPWFAENDNTFRIIENAGNTIEADYDIAMGVFGAWQEDLRAYFVRTDGEDTARKYGESFLSIGTAVENIAHCGINLENIMVGLSTPDQQARVQQQQVAMTALTHLFLSNFKYLFGFYVPHPGMGIILPGQDDSANAYNARIDNAIRAIFGNFGLRIQILDEGTPADKAQVMFETVRDIVENGVPEPTPAEEAMGDHPDAPDAVAPHEDPTLTA